MVRPTEFDLEYLTTGQLDALRCPVCRGLMVFPVTGPRVAVVCPTAGHTGLVRVSSGEKDGDCVQKRFMAGSPKAFQQFDPRRNEYAWNYAMKRMEEHWQEPEVLRRARELAKKRKGRKP